MARFLSQSAAYVLLQDKRDGKMYWGVGMSHNINLAPLRAILSAINRAKRERKRAKKNAFE